MSEEEAKDFLDISGVVELDAEGLQCPLCSRTDGIRLTRLTTVKTNDDNTRQHRYRFLCERCDSTIFFTRIGDIEARRVLAYCKPERGKEYEDYSRGP